MLFSLARGRVFRRSHHNAAGSDGGDRLWIHVFTSDDVYGLYVASRDAREAFSNVAPAIGLLVKLNEGINQYSFLANRLIEQGYELTLFKEDEINLETAFMHLTKGITS